MSASNKCCLGTDFGLFFTRVAMGAYIGLAGYGKAFQMGTDQKTSIQAWMDTYATMQPEWLPEWFATPYGYAIPWAEMIIGGLLVLGLLTRLAGGIGFLMVGSFTTAIVMKNMAPLAEGEEGRQVAANVWEALQMHGPGPFSANVIYATLMLLFLFAGAGRLAVDAMIFGGCCQRKDGDDGDGGDDD